MEINWDMYWSNSENFDFWERPAPSMIQLCKTLDPKKRPEVLDLGCGIGRHALVLAKEGFSVTAVDRSKEALQVVEERAKREGLIIKIKEGNYLEPLFKADSFHIIISYNVIYHGTREEFQKALELCSNYLSQEGLLFFTCPSREDGKYGQGEEVAPHTFISYNSTHPGGVHYFTNEKDILACAKRFSLQSLKKEEKYWTNKGRKEFSSHYEVLLKKD